MQTSENLTISLPFILLVATIVIALLFLLLKKRSSDKVKTRHCLIAKKRLELMKPNAPLAAGRFLIHKTERNGETLKMRKRLQNLKSVMHPVNQAARLRVAC